MWGRQTGPQWVFVIQQDTFVMWKLQHGKADFHVTMDFHRQIRTFFSPFDAFPASYGEKYNIFMVRKGTITHNRQMQLAGMRTLLLADYILPLNCLVTIKLQIMARACIFIWERPLRLFVSSKVPCVIHISWWSLKMSYKTLHTIDFIFLWLNITLQ